MISSVELQNTTFKGVTLPEPYGDFLGEVPLSFSAAIWGPKGSLKSTMAIDLAFVLANTLGKGIFCSSEEGPGPALKNKIDRLQASHENLFVCDYESLDRLKASIDIIGAKFIFIDSISMSYIKPAVFSLFMEFCKKQPCMLYYILHATKEGNYKGPSEFVHWPDAEIKVVDGVAETQKNRFQETPREIIVEASRSERKNHKGKKSSTSDKSTVVDPDCLFGLEYIENPVEEEYRENRSVQPEEIYQTITDRIINTIKEKGHLPWQKEWKDTGLYSGRIATNFVSKNPYRGINYFMLNFEVKWGKNGPYLAPRKMKNPYFLTFNQVNKLEGKIKKGSKGEMVIYFTKLYRYRQMDPVELEFTTKDKKKMIGWLNEHRADIDLFNDGFTAEEIASQSYIPVLKYYNVFNGENIEGIDWGKLPENENADRPQAEKLQIGEAIMEAFPTRPEIKNDQPKAFYTPAGDFINMPKPETFSEPQYYYTTLFHEAIHSTGHASRLSRDLSGRFGSDKYAFEELIAEMGAVYLCGESGILFRTIDNSAKYLKSWNKRLVKEMEEDNKFYFRAASRAQEATDFILDRDAEGIPAYLKDFQANEEKKTKPKRKSSKTMKLSKKEENEILSLLKTDGYKLDDLTTQILQENKEILKNTDPKWFVDVTKNIAKIDKSGKKIKSNHVSESLSYAKSYFNGLGDSDSYPQSALKGHKRGDINRAREVGALDKQAEKYLKTVIQITDTINSVLDRIDPHFKDNFKDNAVRYYENKYQTLIPKSATRSESERISLKALKELKKITGASKGDIGYLMDKLTSYLPEYSPDVKNESVTRDNPGPLSYMGITEKITISQGGVLKEMKGKFPTFLGGDRLYIIPASRVKKVVNKVNSPKAVEAFEEFNNYLADEFDYKINFPDPEEKSIPVGTAKTIWYVSDKVMQAGDKKGKFNHYVHEFDAGKRSAVVKNDVLIIGNIEWDERGILN